MKKINHSFEVCNSYVFQYIEYNMYLFLLGIFCDIFVINCIVNTNKFSENIFSYTRK